ncbi:hypothetical protein Tco_1381521 [Tanacetum coccineum]
MLIGTLKEAAWFTTIWKSSRKTRISDPEKPVMGIMSLEVSRLMTKVANLWHFLSDKQMSRLQDELTNSLGTRNLVSQDNNHLMELALIEIMDIIKCVAEGVSRLGKKCIDPVYHNLDHIFDNGIEIEVKWCGWEYKLKKMDKRVKKMKRFAAVTSQLCEELEVLSELENGLKRMQDNNTNQLKLHEFEKKVLWQREEVGGLREMSTWVRTYDYIVRLLLRSLFTIVQRVKVVFGISPQIGSFGRSNSISAFSVYPSENLIQRSVSNLGDKPKKKYPQRFCGTHTPVNSRGLALGQTLNSLLDCKKRLLSGKKSTLGDAALSLHYANVIIFIERLAISPHFISPDSREDLYQMLTTRIKHSLRAKLSNLSKSNDSEVYNGEIASEWSSTMQRILEWLAPLAHNMIKWHTERNFEKQRMGYGGNVLLVNTLHYADQVKTEDAITDLVLSLDYISRFGREVNDKAFTGSSCGTHCDDYLVCNRNIMSL